MLLRDIAIGIPLEIERDGTFTSLGFVSHARPMMLAYLEDERFLQSLIDNASVSCVLTTDQLAGRVPRNVAIATVPDPRLAFFRLHNHLARTTDFYGASRPTQIAASANVHETAFVSPNDVTIDEGVAIEPRAVILPRVSIGAGSTIRSGAVLGSEGFQVFLANGECIRVAHAGGVRVGQRVDLHANGCVDRSVFGGETIIDDDTTIDNLVYVAHDVRIGRKCRVAAHAVIGGSSTIGDESWIGLAAVISNGITLGNGGYVTMGSVVTQDVPPNARVTGNFAIDHDRYLAFLRTIR